MSWEQCRAVFICVRSGLDRVSPSHDAEATVAAFASVTVGDYLSTAHVKTSLGFRMHAHDEVLCAACPRHEFTFRVLPRLDWFVQDSWQNLSRLGRGLAVELSSVASAATLDVTGDSESSAQSAAQRFVLDPSSRSLSSKVTAVPSDSS